jgi:hypothetical protein
MCYSGSFGRRRKMGIALWRPARSASGADDLRGFLNIHALISWTTIWPISVALVLSTAGSTALAEPLAGTTCPPDFTCFPVAPRDGACRHPAVILDTEVKGTRYEDSPFSPVYEKACIAQTNSSAVRRGLELRLKFGNGASRVYKNIFTEAECEQHQDTCKTYFLYDYFPDHRLFLINVGYNESQEWFLVRQVDGKEQKIIAPPGYSPNRKWLASVYWTDGGDDGNNGIDIFPANLNATEPGFHYRPEEYEAWEFVGWDGDDHLKLKVTWHEGNDQTRELVTWPAEEVRVNGKWQLNRWAPSSSRP